MTGAEVLVVSFTGRQFGVACCLLALGLADSSGSRSIREAILSSDPQVRRKIASEIREARREEIAELMEMLPTPELDESASGPRAVCARLLGQLRAAEAVEVLAAGIAFIPSGMTTDEDIPAERYNVCAVALTEIGHPAIDSMVDEIVTAASEEVRALAAWVLMEIESPEQAVHRLSRIAGDVSDDGTRQNLWEAVRFIEKYDPALADPTRGKGRRGGWK